jgi:FKBP-type peptidyl-prolyl cis-trans isomerase FkpA
MQKIESFLLYIMLQKFKIIGTTLFFLLLLNTNVSGQKNKKFVLPSGIHFEKITSGIGKIKPNIGDQITMHIRVYVSDSMLFDSYRLNNEEPVPAKITAPQFNGDIMEALRLLVAGDSAVLQVAQDSLFRNGMTPQYAKSGDMVQYQIKMVSIERLADYNKKQKKAQQKSLKLDTKKIEKYISDRKLGVATKTKSGLQYIITKKTEAALPIKGQTVKMNYTGRLLNDTIFDSNLLESFGHVTPLEFELGKGAVIKGWDEAILLMQIGEKFTLFIPSYLAYGTQDKPGMPANSVLIFDVELLEVVKKE